MKHYDNHEIEIRLNNEGYNLIAGTDEVGRGPLAGPVVAACCIMPKDCIIEGVTDSKKISEKNRKILEGIIKEKAKSYKVVFIDPKKIDEINIYEASRLAMTKAINELTVKPDYVLADAMPLFIDIKSESIIKGDEKSFTIACASILAKVARDEYMVELDKLYPEYGFAKHKGYPTKQHLEAIKEYGILDLHHRKSYGPVKDEALKGNFNKNEKK
ncbi:MAG: ribonuclease HII [Bacilli bacterium]|nr:ribonuclease HII [Bacilli bacterium]